MRLSVVGPSVVRPGETFALKLAALDADGYPSRECESTAAVTHRGRTHEVVFQSGRPAVATLDGFSVHEPGFHRLAALLDGVMYPGNPIWCDAQTPRIFWGDPHVHTVLSDCHPDTCRSLDFCHIAARYLTGLDWVCAADHVSTGRGSVGKWNAQRAAAAAFNDPPDFVTLLGYEASLVGGAGGDNNVYFADDAPMWVDAYEGGDTRTLSEALAEYDCILIPHHTTRTGKHGELADRTYLGPERMPAVEIHSKWGTGEYRGNPNPLGKVHPGPAYAQDLLCMGYPLGFVAGTDSHATMPSGYGREPSHVGRLPGLTAVRAPVLSRRAVYDAIKARNCYAVGGERIIIDASIAGGRMGTEIGRPDPGAPRPFVARVAAESQILRIDVVRNRETVYSQEGDSWLAELEWEEALPLSDVLLPPAGYMTRPFVFYYLRVTTASGAQAWTSPVWLVT